MMATVHKSRATDEEHVQYHHLHCCVGSWELGVMMAGGGSWSQAKLRATLAGTRSECPECRRLGWTGSDSFG